MYRSSSGRLSLSSSSRSKESSSSSSRTSRSGVCTSGSTRDRIPRRSRSPSPRGRRRRSSSSSRSSRRSPSPRRSRRVRSPSGGSRSHRGSEQRDGSLSQRCSPGRHSGSSQRHPRFWGSSPSRHFESSVEQNLKTEFNSDFYGVDPREQRRLSDRLGSHDSLSDIERGYLDDDSVRGLSYSRSLEQYRSHQESPPSSFSTKYDKDYRGWDAFLHQSDSNMKDYRLEELDRNGKLFTKSLHPSEEERLNPKRPRYDREDRLLDVSTNPQGSLSEKRNYYRQSLSGCQMYPDEDYRKLVSSRRNREEVELSKNTCQDCPDSDYVIRGSLQSSESRYFCRPDEALAMSKESVLKKWVDDPTMQPSEQNFGSFLRKKESADLGDDFLLPHERASQDESGVSHVLGRMADSTSAQAKRRHSLFDTEDEERFLYGDDEDDSNISCPSTEKLTMNGGKESVSLNKSPPSIPSAKPDNSEGSEIEYEKIHDLLKSIGLDIGVAEIGKGAARTQERLHGKKTLRSLDGPSHKADSSEKDGIQSNTHSSESNRENSLSPCGSSQPSDDVSSASISKHAKSKTLEYDNSAGPLEQSFPSVSTVTPSAPPLLPNLPPPPPQVSQYSLSQFSAFLAAQILQNYPPSTMVHPSYNAYRHCMASAWPMFTPPQQSKPALPNVHRLASMTGPLKPDRSNLRVIETVSTIKGNPENKRNKSVLVEVPITPSDSRLLSQSSSRGTTKTISDGKNPAIEKPQGFKLDKKMPTNEECNEKEPGVTAQSGNNSDKTPDGALLLSNLQCEQPQIVDEREKKTADGAKRTQEKKIEKGKLEADLQEQRERELLKVQQEGKQRKLQYLMTELDRVSKQQRQMQENRRGFKHRKNYKDPLLKAVNQARRHIMSEIDELQKWIEEMEKKQAKPDKILNENPSCEETRCEKQKEAKDEKSTKVARKEESEITKFVSPPDSSHCHPQFVSPSRPSLCSWIPLPDPVIPYNMYIPPFSDSLLYTLQRAETERKQWKW